MEIAVLGPLRVVVGGCEVTPTGGRQRRALVALVDAGAAGATIDQLAEIVWDDDDRPFDHAAHLRTVINRLRRQVDPTNADGSVVVTRSGGYVLGADETPVGIDAWQFEQQLGAAHDELDPVRRAELLAAALGLWRGRPFDELADLPQLGPAVARLMDLELTAEEDHAAALLDIGDDERALERVTALLDHHPYRERLRQSQVVALYRLGRQTDALRTLQGHRRRMLDDLGVEPSPDLAEIEQSVLHHDPMLRSPVGATRSLRGYRIGRVVGAGSDSVVYHGWQPGIDRPVAIKVVRADLADDPSCIRRFEQEATVLARLEHPFIVPLHDFWREPGQAYLVSRLLPGSLAERAAEAAWPAARIARLVEQVGTALDAAHRAGIAHRAVKPSNVLLDDDGNAYLTDFGLARLAGPPRADGLPVAVTGDDVRNLLAIVRTLAVGTGTTDAAVGLVDALERAAQAAAPDQALSAVVAIAATARTGDVDLGTVRLDGHPSNPYRGLLPFESVDEQVFVGRDREIDELRRRWVDGDRLIVVTGASGIGKSSLVRAGLLPALGRGDLDGEPGWRIATLTPDRDAFRALFDAIASIATSDVADLRNALESGSASLADLVGAAFGELTTPVVLVIDQLEEAFGPATPSDVAERWLSLLSAAVADDRLRLRVVATLRADHFATFGASASFGAALARALVPIGPLDREGLSRAIVQPAERVGVLCEPALVARLLTDVERDPMSLPLMQLTLHDLFDRRVDDRMTDAAYRPMVGLSHALAGRAEELTADLDDRELQQVRSMFTELVDHGDERAPVRRRVAVTWLVDAGVPSSMIEAAIDARLLAIGRDVRSRVPTVEVTHEAVFRAWPLLAEWIDDDRDRLRRRARLEAAASTWDTEGRDESGLLRGRRLDDAEELLDELPVGPTERDLVERSLDSRRRQEQRDRRRRAWLAATAAVAVLVASIAVLAGLVANRERDRASEAAERARDAQGSAETSRQLAETRAAEAEAAAESEAAATIRAEQAAAEAEAAAESEAAATIQAEQAAAESERSAAAATTEVLIRAARAEARTQPVLARQLAVAAFDRSDNASTRNALAGVLSASPELIERAATFSDASCVRWSVGPAPGMVAIVNATRSSAQIVEATTGELVRAVDVPATRASQCPQPTAGGDRVWANAPDGGLLMGGAGPGVSGPQIDRASWTDDQRAVVGVANGRPATLIVLDGDDLAPTARIDVELLDLSGVVEDVRATTATGQAIVADGGFQPVVVDLATGEQRLLPAGKDIVFTLDVVDDGRMVAGLGQSALTVWDTTAPAGEPPLTVELQGSPLDQGGVSGPAIRPALSPSGDRIAVITNAGVEVFATADGAPLGPPLAGAASSGALRFLDEDRLAVLTSSGDLIHLDIGRSSGLARVVLADLPDGGLVAADGSTVTLVDGDRLVALPVEGGEPVDLGPARDVGALTVDRTTTVLYEIPTARYRRIDSGRVVHESDLAGIDETNPFLGQSPRVGHGRVLLTLRGRSNIDNPTGQVVVLDYDSGEVLTVLDLPGVRRPELIGPDEFIHAGFDGLAHVRDFDGNVVETIGPLASNISVAVAGTDDELLVGLDDGRVLIWSRESQQVVSELAGPPEPVIGIEVADNRAIVVQHISGRLQVWWPEIDADLVATELLGPNGFTGLAQVVDDRTLVTAGGDLLAVSLDPAEWKTQACAVGADIDPSVWRATTGILPPDDGVC